MLDYRCNDCRRVFNLFTQTPLHKTQKTPAQWVLILRTFRGVNKDSLQQYAAVFQWTFCLGNDLKQFLRLMLAVSTTGGR